MAILIDLSTKYPVRGHFRAYADRIRFGLRRKKL